MWDSNFVIRDSGLGSTGAPHRQAVRKRRALLTHHPLVVHFRRLHRKVDVRLPGTRNSNSHGARPVYSNHIDDSVDSDQ